MIKKGIHYFLDQSLRVKLLSIWLVMIVILQVFFAWILQGVMSRNYEEQITRSKRQTLEQISYNLNQNFYDIVEKMIEVREQVQLSQNQNDLFKKEYFNNHTQYEVCFNRLVASGNNYRLIDSMLVMDRHNVHYYSLDHYNLQGGVNPFDDLKRIYPNQEPCIWTGVMDASYAKEGDQVISIIMPVSRYGDIKSMVVVNLSVDKLQNYLSELNTTQDQVLLETGEGKGHIGTGEAGIWADMEKIRRLALNQGADQNDLVLADELSINQWNLYMMCGRQGLSAASGVVPLTLLAILFAAGLVTFVLGYFVIVSITRPLNKLTSIMSENGKSRDLDGRFHARYKDEIGIMAAEYNHMMDEMQELVRNIEQEQLQNRKNYLKLLQLQIKPHFLYNSLEATRFLVEMKDPAAVDMISAIGRFYKLSLSGVKDIVTLGEEKEQLSCYLRILKIRYSSKYDYELDIPEEFNSNEIVKFSLQPLVENAVYHGVKNSRRKGLIRITAQAEGENLVVEVWDNGAGIPAARLREIQEEIQMGQGRGKTEHIGIVNVHQRIRMYCSEPYGIQIQSEEGVYTSVKVVLPIREYREEGEENHV